MAVYKRSAEGKIVKKGEGTWYYDFSTRGRRYKRALCGIKTRAQAEAIEVQVRAAVYTGTYEKLMAEAQPKKSVIGFSDFVKTVYLPYQKNVEKIRCYQAYVGATEYFCRFFKNKPLDQITHVDVDTYRVERLMTPKSTGKQRQVNSVNLELLRLSGIFTLAIKRDLIGINPCTRVERPKINDQRTRVLLPDEETKLLKALAEKHPSFVPVVQLALHTAMRLRELVELRWEYVDFAHKVINIPASLNKTKVPRTIGLNDQAAELLASQRTANQTEGKVFAAKEVKYKPLSVAVSRLADECGLPDVTMHTLRHTAITRMIERGASLTTVRAQAGHTNIATTQRYTHTSIAELHKAAKTLET